MSQAASARAQLEQHLTALEQDPALPIDERIFEKSQHLLVVPLLQNPSRLVNIVSRLAAILVKTQHDPKPAVELLSRLVGPLTFTDVISLQPPIDLIAGLNPEALPFNLLVLSLISKASRTSKDAAILAGMPHVAAALVKLWLSSSDMGIADEALSIIVALLEIDRESTVVPVHGVGSVEDQSGGQGLFWRRMFGDKDVYGLLFSLTSLADISSKTLSNRDKSVAQARLLSFIPQLGRLDWSYAIRSHHSEIEIHYGLEAGQGLLHYATLHMVDYKNDVLLHMNLLQFFAELLSTITTPSGQSQSSSISLEYLVANGLHRRSTSFWLDPDNASHDPVDVRFLYGPSAHYMAIYASLYPDALMEGQELAPAKARLSAALGISANQWANGQSPKHDLSVLAAMPRAALLPSTAVGEGRRSSPLLLVPCKLTNEDALHTLATILGGPRADDGMTSSRFEEESQVAAVLFHHYHRYHPTLFADLVTHADTVALPAKALAALALLKSIVSARWLPRPPSPDGSQARHLEFPTTASPVAVLLTQPARDSFLPYILRPPRTFTNLVGGGGRDPESSAYKVAVAKWECLLTLQRRLETWGPKEHADDDATPEQLGLEAVKRAVAVRAAEGVWGGAQHDMGGRIATLEL